MKRHKALGLFSLLASLSMVSVSAVGQVATSPIFTLEQSVIANGGGASSGGAYGVEGTIAQSIAGTNSTSANFGLRGGFWQTFFASTAAMVSVTGQLMTSEGQPVRLARVLLADGRGNIRSALSSDFGYFRFDDIEVGQTYIVSVVAKRFQFVPRVVSVNDELTSLDLIALP